jgi:Transposase, Mutator family
MPVGHRRRPRTSKLMERHNEGIERRTRVQDLFPNEASALRLIVARSPASPRRAAERRQVSGPLPTRLSVVTIEPRVAVKGVTTVPHLRRAWYPRSFGDQ